jgi:glycosyltransferase involved in cell wall biosynthesis
MDTIVQSFRRFKSAQMANAALHIDGLSRYILADTAPNYKGPDQLRDSYPSVKYIFEVSNRLTPRSGLGGWAIKNLFDRFAKRSNPECDLFVGYSGFCLHSLEHANANGSTTVVFRGAPHGEFGQDYLNDQLIRDGFESGTQTTTRMTNRENQEYAEADVVWVPSEFTAKSLRKYGVESSKIEVRPWGIELDSFHPRNRQTNCSDSFKLLYVGSVTPEKGVHHLIDAVAEVNVSDVSLKLVGRLDDRLASRIEAADAVDHEGWVDRSRLTKFYQDASLFVCPSLADGYPSVVLEALASGCPTVVTENVGSKELVVDHDAGWVVPPADVNALVEVIETASNEPQKLERMGNMGRLAVENGFSIREKEKEFASFFQSIVE